MLVRSAATSASASSVCLWRRFSAKIDAGKTPYEDRSAVTRLLWDQRLQKGGDSSLKPLVDKTPSESHLELVLPFSSDPILREQYISPFGHVRIGRLLEDLDAFAGNVAFHHAFPSRPTIVTASVNKLDLIPKSIDPTRDLRISGGVTSVGSSSMEIRIDAFQGEGWPLILTTYFTMVARDPATNKPTPINPLVPVTEEEKQRKIEGDKNKEERLLAKKMALEVSVPTMEEMKMIHQFFMSDHAASLKNGIESGGPHTEVVSMADTHQRSLIFCSHQQRNIHNKIFGGYLMRKAFELAFSTAYLFAGRRPFFSALGDITFSNAVPIGALLDLRSAVVYSEKNDIQVHVTARVHDPEKRSARKTNDFAFSFDLYDESMSDLKCVRTVRPRSYDEAMSYLMGRRALLRHRQ